LSELAYGTREPHVQTNDRVSALTTYDDEIARLAAEVEHLRSEIDAIYQSTSWKVTAPMRGVKNAGLRLRSALQRTIIDRARSRRRSCRNSRRCLAVDRPNARMLWLLHRAHETRP